MEIESKEDLAIWISGEIKESKLKSSEWRKSAKECYSFYSGDQWDDDDKAVLEEQGRPPVVFNRVARTINAIAGLEVQNRQEVRYIPREINDNGVNELLTAASKWVRDNCDAEDEESEAFQDALICGMGWTDTRLDYETDPDGEIVVERGDPLHYFWDTSAKKRNLDDTRWRAKVHQMSDKDVKDRWPDYEMAEAADLLLEDEDSPTKAYPPFYDGNEKRGETRKTREIVEFQWYDKVSYYRVLDVTGKILELDEEQYTKMLPAIEGMGAQTVKQQKRVYKVAFLCGKEILEQRELETQAGFTINCITGMRDRNNGMWFGLVALMQDPQRWANKWLSQIMHILNSNSKGGLMAEKDAFDNPRKAEEEWSEPNSITWLRPGGLGKVQQKQISQMPTGIEGLLKYALESINDVPGVNSELLGLADRQQANVLETNRKQSGITMMAVIFDSLRRYRKEQGRILADMIKEYIADGRLIRIVGDQGAQVIPLLRDPLTFKYDVVVDDSPTSPNMKERTFSILQAMLPQLMQAGVPIPPDILDYSPLPESLVQKWKQMLPNTDQNSPESQQVQMLTQQMQQMAAQMQQMQTDMSLKAEELKIKAFEAETKRLELQNSGNAEQIRAVADVRVAEIEAQKELVIASSQAKEPEDNDDAQENAAIGAIAEQLSQIAQMIQAPQQPVTVIVEKGGTVRKEMAIQAPSGQVYTGVITESEDD